MQLLNRFRLTKLLSSGSPTSAVEHQSQWRRDVLMGYLEHRLQMAGATRLMAAKLPDLAAQ
ncbi:uncharacterized protein Dmul_24700 [Desulfococcus multivorans]|jgi:hypothetical protein|nr:uncharacterized protein Dmul_24700 [Desulfococcus multivorans]